MREDDRTEEYRDTTFDCNEQKQAWTLKKILFELSVRVIVVVMLVFALPILIPIKLLTRKKEKV